MFALVVVQIIISTISFFFFQLFSTTRVSWTTSFNNSFPSFLPFCQCSWPNLHAKKRSKLLLTLQQDWLWAESTGKKENSFIPACYIYMTIITLLPGQEKILFLTEATYEYGRHVSDPAGVTGSEEPSTGSCEIRVHRKESRFGRSRLRFHRRKTRFEEP